ncbi:MAG: Gfo/Idh/MocA family oxidoreductase [Verrucomicrobia bacterium]|nr:Gfo/Idh/MocA family oxidoreductase [Verrucomicrobiota bacterium]
MKPSRRSFLAGTASVTAGLAFPAILRARNPNSKLQIASVGCGGRGGSNLKEMIGEDIVALADVNARNLDAAKSLCPAARPYSDFREMLAAELDKIDAVVVSTTEHTHAFVTLPALRAGKHVYSEKPLTRDVNECRRIIEAAAAKPHLATQMGTQIHAGENYRRVVELIRANAIGPVKEVHVWVSRAWGWQSASDAVANKDIVQVSERPAASEPVPEGLNWDLWIGPAPFRPFHPVYFPGPKWYRWWDFGNGTMSDLGSHWNDLPWWALDLDAPLTIEAGGPPPHPEIAPASMWARYTYGPKASRPGLTLTWYQGAEKPEILKNGGIPPWNNGVLFIGSEGMLLADYGRHLLLPEAKFANFTRPPQSIPPSIGHHQEWIQACKTGSPTTCPFSYSGPLTEANHLGNVAYRAGKKLEWDSARMTFPNAPDADKFLSRTYRDGWTL